MLTKLANLIDIRDAFVFGGIAMLGYGLYQIYPPAAWIAVGGIIFLLGLRS